MTVPCDFPTSNNVYTITDNSLKIRFALKTEIAPERVIPEHVDENGVTIPEQTVPAEILSNGYEHEHFTSECPQEVQDALQVVKNHMNQKAQEDFVEKGFIFN